MRRGARARAKRKVSRRKAPAAAYSRAREEHQDKLSAHTHTHTHTREKRVFKGARIYILYTRTTTTTTGGNITYEAISPTDKLRAIHYTLVQYETSKRERCYLPAIGMLIIFPRADISRSRARARRVHDAEQQRCFQTYAYIYTLRIRDPFFLLFWKNILYERETISMRPGGGS